MGHDPGSDGWAGRRRGSDRLPSGLVWLTMAGCAGY